MLISCSRYPFLLQVSGVTGGGEQCSHEAKIVFSSIFFEHVKRPSIGLSWKTEIYRPKDLRAGAFSIHPIQTFLIDVFQDEKINFEENQKLRVHLELEQTQCRSLTEEIKKKDYLLLEVGFSCI